MRIDEDFFRLSVEDWPVTDGVAHNTVAIRRVLEDKRAEIGCLLVELALLHVSLFTMEVCGLDLGSCECSLVQVVVGFEVSVLQT